MADNHNILILFAHPRFERSRANAQLVRHIPRSERITFHDLYERYPDFNVNLAHEKHLLTRHDIVIWHHPFYWYGAPPLLKQWIDISLEFGWAYGPGGTALTDKIFFNAITSGGPRQAYTREGHHQFTVQEFLTPFRRTATLCHARYWPPFAVHGTHRIGEAGLLEYARQYRRLLERLLDGDFDPDKVQEYMYLNDWLTQTQQ